MTSPFLDLLLEWRMLQGEEPRKLSKVTLEGAEDSLSARQPGSATKKESNSPEEKSDH